MAARISDLLLRVHTELKCCHRDVHIGNIVLTDQDAPLLIGPKWCAPARNEYCYDLYGSQASKVPVPDLHVKQGHTGVWWGSAVGHRSLLGAFGPWPGAPQ